MERNMNLRLPGIESELLEALVEEMKERGLKANSTFAVHKAIYHFAVEMLGEEKVAEIVNRNYGSL